MKYFICVIVSVLKKIQILSKNWQVLRSNWTSIKSPSPQGSGVIRKEKERWQDKEVADETSKTLLFRHKKIIELCLQAQDMHKAKLKYQAWIQKGLKNSCLYLRSLGSWQMLGEGEAVLFGNVNHDKLPMLQ